MTIEITPRGSKGWRVPGFLRPLMRLGMGWMAGRYRRTRGKVKVGDQDLLLLTTIGAKSGERRSILLSRFPDGAAGRSWLVAATNMGAVAHPAWLHNIAKHPDQVWVEIDGHEYPARAEQLRGADRDAAWARIVELNPSFGRYTSQTDREIPVLRLTERGEETDG